MVGGLAVGAMVATTGLSYVTEFLQLRRRFLSESVGTGRIHIQPLDSRFDCGWLCAGLGPGADRAEQRVA